MSDAVVAQSHGVIGSSSSVPYFQEREATMSVSSDDAIRMVRIARIEKPRPR